MNTGIRPVRPLLAPLAALMLLAPASTLAAQPGTTATGTTATGTTTTVVPTTEATTTPTSPSAPTEASPSTFTPEAPATSAPTSTAQPPPAPGPEGSSAPPLATTPQVQTEHAQGSTRGRPFGSNRSGAKANRGRSGQSPSSAVSRPGARAGRRAPPPSTLTPALPLAFSLSLAGVPSFFIESFRIPPFLLPIYQAAGTAYGVPWQVLAAINEVATDYGRDLSVSSAGAEGWMQFLPSSWAAYGVDANGDGFKDPYNPADAIFAAARYLRAAGAATDLRGAIFAYNHSRAYVESVLLRARLLGGTPSELLGALSGLTQGHFPVHAASHFSDGFPPAPPGPRPSRTLGRPAL